MYLPHVCALPLVRPDGTLERTPTDIALAGLETFAVHTTISTDVTGASFFKPISNAYQMDLISRACILTTFSLVSEPHHGFRDVYVSGNGTGRLSRARWVQVGDVVSG
jgi:hypothetical protein